MLTLDECVKRAPISIVCIATQAEIVSRYLDVEDTHSLDTVNVEFAATGRQALSMALKEPQPAVVWGVIRYMKGNNWSLEEKLQLLSAFSIAGLEIADDITDEDLPHLLPNPNPTTFNH